MSTRALAAVAALAAAALLLGGCTKSHPAVINSTVTETVTHTRPPPPGQALPAHTVAPLPPNQSPAKGEVEKVCPYIHSNFTDGTPNVADDEGNRVYRTTVITTMNPVGCRFYFWAGPYEAVADIVTQRYSSAAVAQSSMVATAKAGHSAQTVNGLSPGVNGVLYQTVFFSDDGSSDWACAFTKGALLVIVHTNQTNASFNAQQLAQDIAPKI